MPTPLIVSGTVALGGSNVTLGTAPSYRALVIKNVTITGTNTAAAHVFISSAAVAAANSNNGSVFDAYVSSTGGVVDAGEGYHFQPNDVATLVVPSGTGNIAYAITFDYA